MSLDQRAERRATGRPSWWLPSDVDAQSGFGMRRGLLLIADGLNSRRFRQDSFSLLQAISVIIQLPLSHDSCRQAGTGNETSPIVVVEFDDGIIVRKLTNKLAR